METSHSWVPLLNFQGGPGVLILNFNGSRVPFFNFEGGAGCRISQRKYLNIFNLIMSLSLERRHQNFVYTLSKRSQQYTEQKNTFLRCKDLTIS